MRFFVPWSGFAIGAGSSVLIATAACVAFMGCLSSDQSADVSAEAAALADQAAIAECLAGETRQMVAAWTLDVKSSRGYASLAYEREMGRMIEAGDESARAMEAWADAARQAAVDGHVAAGEAAIVEAAERDMADAEAAAYAAFMSTSAGQFAGELGGGSAPHVPDFEDAHMQSLVLSGEGTECY